MTSASAHFRASAPVPALEAVIDWILAHPQPAFASGSRQVEDGVAGLATNNVAFASLHSFRKF